MYLFFFSLGPISATPLEAKKLPNLADLSFSQPSLKP